MDLTNVDQIVNAVLYQDHILYPYRPSSSRRRRQHFTPGRIFPDYYCIAQNGAEPCMIQSECLLRCHLDNPTLNVRVRFLHPAWREIQVPTSESLHALGPQEPGYRVVPEIVIGGKIYQTWEEALEREITISPIPLLEGERLSVTHGFRISAWGEVENIGDAEKDSDAILVRRQEALEGRVEIAANPLSARCFQISVRIRNETPIATRDFADHDAIAMRTFNAAHAILHTQGAEFISPANPPTEFAHFISTCENLGAWPVLMGEEAKSQRDTILASPVLLADYPQVPADALDAKDLIELIELREVTMAAAEKRETAGDGLNDWYDAISELADNDVRHPTAVRQDWTVAEDFFVGPKPVSSAVRNGIEIKAGDRVRIAPTNHADILDLMLAGRIATVESLEQDAAKRIQLSVALLDKAGHDLRFPQQPEHRFTYGLDEIEPLIRPLA